MTFAVAAGVGGGDRDGEHDLAPPAGSNREQPIEKGQSLFFAFRSTLGGKYDTMEQMIRHCETQEMELVHGSGNVFRDFGRDDADLRQAKALMASEIIRIIDDRQWTTRKAEAATGISHADYSRIRLANLSRFTLDRLMTILTLLGQEVELAVKVRPRPMQGPPAATGA